MRILQVRLKNLNSLVGEWDIDLTHPAYSSEGIFAITGPTGSGKTTVLDAICLALYGRTPRLNKVNKSGNEIMSRQTGECFAEVTFETQAGRFRCHWSQHKARRKATGELQQPKQEIALADSGEILDTKIRGVADQIEATTGMDFERFTRSMLLAQGGFAAFLEASPDGRAPILEQITGTRIYSDVSVRVHERRLEERKTLELLQATLEGLQVLSEEEEGALRLSLEAMNGKEVDLAQRLAQTNQTIAWLDNIARLRGELKGVYEAQEGLDVRLKEFAPRQEILNRAKSALQLSGKHSTLTSSRSEQAVQRTDLTTLQASLPVAEATAKQASAALEAADKVLKACKGELQGALPSIRKAQELDLKIQEKSSPIGAASKIIAESEATLEALRTLHGADCAQLEGKQRDLQSLNQQLEETRTDEQLVEQLAGIRGSVAVLRGIREGLNKRQEESRKAQELLARTNQGWERLELESKKHRQILKSCEGDLGRRKEKLKVLLEGKEPAQWRAVVESLKSNRGLLDKATDAVDTVEKSTQALEQLKRRRKGLETDSVKTAADLKVRLEQQASLEKEIGFLEAEHSLLQRIASLESAREHLSDGEPCPLCGATDHPFAEGNVPVPEQTQQRLSASRAALRAGNEAISGLKVKQATLVKDLERVASQEETNNAQIDASRGILEEVCKPHDLDPSEPDLRKKLQERRRVNGKELDRATQVVQQAEIAMAELESLRDSLARSTKQVAEAERMAQQAAHEKETVEGEIARLAKEGEELKREWEKTFASLKKDVEGYGFEGLAEDNLKDMEETLEARRDLWTNRQRKKILQEKEIVALVTRTGNQAEQIEKEQGELLRRRKTLDGLSKERDVLVEERRKLFGEKDPEGEHRRLEEAVGEAGKKSDVTRQERDAATQGLRQLHTRLEELEKSISIRATQLESLQEEFAKDLRKRGFVDEGDFDAACLQEEEREALDRESRELEVARVELDASRRDKTQLLEQELKKKLTEQPREELDAASLTLATQLRELQQDIGSIAGKLKEDKELKKSRKGQVEAIEAQQRECSRWDLLHELIGSADGKKYRNFAQGLTFEMMVGHANRQLQKMTDRYLLVLDPDQPLELRVIDGYQAGENRSTKNLSGGESFLVSLALALGLSKMASRKVRVDSLFLDEGFGTLDDEALDTALSTLSGLRQDGKLIGVISHVPALKERIPTQIQVSRQTGGRSTLSGPGTSEQIST